MISCESSGKLYESWLLVLLLIKAYGLQFDIGKEVKIGDKFDDVAIRYEDSNYTNYIFCQVKLIDDGHEKVLNESVLLGKETISMHNDDFNLKKYFLSYLRIRDQFQNSDNKYKLTKLLFYTNVSDLDEGLKKQIEENPCEYSRAISAKDERTTIYLDKDSVAGKEIIEELKKITTDFRNLIDEFLKYIKDSKLTDMKFKGGSAFDYYQYALINEEILQVQILPENKTTQCSFHKNFQTGKFRTSRAKNFYYTLLRDSAMHEDQFKERLKNINWKVWNNFGKQEGEIIISLPTIEIILEDDIVMNFLDTLEFRVNEPVITEYQERVKVNIEKLKLYNFLDLNYIRKQLFEYIQSWRQEKRQAEDWILHKDIKNCLENFKRDDYKTRTKIISFNNLYYYEKLDKYKISVDEQLQNSLSHYCEHLKQLHVTVIYSKEIFFTVLKVVRYMNTKENQFLYFNEEDLRKYVTDRDIKALLEDNDDTVIINWRSEESYDELLHEILSLDNLKKCIIITSYEGMKFDDEEVTFDFSYIYDEEVSIDDFENVTDILEIELDCQGKKIPIKDIVGENHPLKEILTSDTIKKLVKEELEGLKLKNSTEKLSKPSDPSYLTRTIRPRSFTKELFTCSSIENELFVISGVTDEKKKKEWLIYRDLIVFLEDENIESQLATLMEQKPGKNIHWLKYKSNLNRFIWKRTLGSVSFLLNNEKNMKPSENLYIDETTLTKFTNNLQIVTGVAGMGKSALLTNIQAIYGRQHSNSIVRTVILNEKRDILSELAKQPENIHPEDFFSNLLDYKNPLEKQLLRYTMKTQEGMLLLLDGYDEIQDKESRSVLRKNILRLTEMTRIKVIITSRTSLVKELETECSVLAVTLQQFTPEDQKSFLLDIFIKKMGKKNTETNLEAYVDEILRRVSTQVKDKETALVGVPLQLRMLSEIIINNYKCENLSIATLPERFDLITLYQYFVKTMFCIYHVDKEKTPEEYVERLVRQKFLTYESYVSNHQTLAICSLLRQTDKLTSIFPNIKPETVSEMIHSTGIITLLSGGELNFIHQTFAEYLFATFLFEKCMLSKYDSEKIDEFIFGDVLCDNSYQNVRTFLNCLLEREKLPESFIENNRILLEKSSVLAEKTVLICYHIIYNSVLESCEQIFNEFATYFKDNQEVSQLFLDENYNGFNTEMLFSATENNNTHIIKWLLVNGINKESKNHEKKTALHIASKKGNYEAAKVLIEEKINLDAQDALLNTPIFYAILSRYFRIVELLVKSNCDVNHGNIVGERPIHYSALNGYKEILTFLVKNKADVTQTNSDKDSTLHYAARNDDVDVVRYLVEKLHCDINCHNEQNRTPLHYGAIMGHLSVVNYLIEMGADIHIRDKDGKTPAECALEKGHADVVRLLRY